MPTSKLLPTLTLTIVASLLILIPLTYWRAFRIGLYDPTRTNVLAVMRGTLIFAHTEWPTPGHPFHSPLGTHFAYFPPPPNRKWSTPGDPGLLVDLDTLGFLCHITRGGTTPPVVANGGTSYTVIPPRRDIGIPLWLPALPLAFLTLRSHRRQQRLHRLTRHLCPSCGYDLRATPERCPECGHTPPSPTVPRGPSTSPNP